MTLGVQLRQTEKFPIYRFSTYVLKTYFIAMYRSRKLKISIDVPTLIARAKNQSGMNYGTMAQEMHIHHPRISEWIKGKAQPTTDQIAYLADKAELPIVETVAALRPEWAHIWNKAVGSSYQSQDKK